MKTILIFSFVEYVVPALIFCVLLCVMSYYIGLILRNRAEIKMMHELSEIKYKHQLEIRALEDDITNRKYQYEKKHEIYTDLILFLDSDKLNNTALNQKAKAVELVASEDIRSILSEYSILDGKIPSNLSRLKNAMRMDLRS